MEQKVSCCDLDVVVHLPDGKDACFRLTPSDALTIGRMELDAADRTMSRRQATFTLLPPSSKGDSVVIQLVAGGTNPVRVQHADGSTEIVAKGEECVLHPEDACWLVRTRYPVSFTPSPRDKSKPNSHKRKRSGLQALARRTSSITGISPEFAALFGVDALGRASLQGSGCFAGDVAGEEIARAMQEEEDKKAEEARAAAASQEAKDAVMAAALAAQMEAEAAFAPPREEREGGGENEDEALARALAAAEEAEAEAIAKAEAQAEADMKMAQELDAHLQAELENPNDVPTLADAFVQRLFTSPGIKVSSLLKLSSEVLETKFEVKWAEFQAAYGKASPESRPVLLFHGTTSAAVDGISRKGFLVPGSSGAPAHRTDDGWYGRGVYFSPSFSLAASYSTNSQVIVAAVVPGRIKQLDPGDSSTYRGQPCTIGYDMHVAGNEWVVFQAEQILPLFLLKFSSSHHAPGPSPLYLPSAASLPAYKDEGGSGGPTKRKRFLPSKSLPPLAHSMEAIKASPLWALTVPDLRQDLVAAGLSSKGTKPYLVDRLLLSHSATTTTTTATATTTTSTL